MNNKPFQITTSNRTSLAKAYRISRLLLNEWIEAEPELKNKLKKYKRTFPPKITKEIIAVFGEP